MDIKDIEKIGIIAQEISFAFEDQYFDEDKRKVFTAIFERFLPITGSSDPYDAIILLGRTNPSEFEQMIKELKENSLIPD